MNGRHMAKRYFENLAEGERLDCRPVVFHLDDITGFAARFDPQPFHTDPDAASRSVFGGIVASSLHVLSACTRSVVEAQGDVAIISGVGLEEVRMHNPVRPGDTLTIEAFWTDLKRSRTKPERGFATIRCQVSNQRAEPVIDYGYRYLLAAAIGSF